MSDAASILKILIQLGVAGESDIKAATELLKENKAAAGALGKEFGGVTENSGSAAKNLEKSGEAAGETAKKTMEAAEAAGEQNKQLHIGEKLISQLNRASPQLGTALKAAFSGPLGAVIVLGMAFAEAKSKLQEFNAEADEISADMVSEHAAAVALVKQAWDDAAAALGKYKSLMETAGTGGDPIAKQVGGIKAIADAQVEATRSVIDALGKQEIAWLRAHGATPEHIAQVEDRIASEKASQKSTNDLELEQQMRQEKQAEMDEKAQAALAAQAEAKKRFSQDQDEMNRLRRALNDPTNSLYQRMTADEESAANNLARVQNIQRIAPTPEAKARLQAEVDAAQANLDRVMAERERYLRRLAQLESTEAERTQDVTTADTNAANATRQSVVNRTRLKELPDEIERAGKLRDIKQNADDVAATLNQRGGQLNMTLGQLAAATGKTHEQTLNIVQGILNKTAGLGQRIAQLEAQLRQQERINSQRPVN